MTLNGIDMIDTSYGHQCCVAAYCHPELLPAYRAHLVAQIGASAPTESTIRETGKSHFEATQMGVTPRCYYCGRSVAPFGCCTCVVEGMPFRADRAACETAVARKNTKFVAAAFACSTCGACGTMTAEQLLRANGNVYKECTNCVRVRAVVAKKASPEMHAAKGFGAAMRQKLEGAVQATLTQTNAKLEAALQAARAAQAEVASAKSALRDAEKAVGPAKAAAVAAQAELAQRVHATEIISRAARQSGLRPEDLAATVSPSRAAAEEARKAFEAAEVAFGAAQAGVKDARKRYDAAKATQAKLEAEVMA